MNVDITGLDKAGVLHALVTGCGPVGMGALHHHVGFTIDEARAAVVRSADLSFDYVNGVPVKVRLTGDSFDPCLYDRDHGDGAAAFRIEQMRSEMAS